MSTLGCTADDALDQTRSCRSGKASKVTEVARKIIESPGFMGR